MLLLALTSAPAFAITQPEAIDRAAEVDPDAVIAALRARKEASQTVQAYANLGLTPSVSVSETFGSAATSSVSVSTSLLDPPSWFSALAQGENLHGARATADATARDTRFGVAALWFQAFAAQEAEDLAQTSLSEARGTADAAEARLRAGLTSELDAKAARLGVLNAQATLASAQSTRFIALARLSSAIQVDVAEVDAPEAPQMPDATGVSPWLAVYEANVQQARWNEAAAWANLFPSPSLSGSHTLLPASTSSAWAITLSASWSFSGLVSPFLDVQTSHIDRKVAELQLDAQRRADALDVSIARAKVDAAKARRSAAVDGEKLAAETVTVGKARLGAGLISTLDVLKLQEQEAQARVQRVSAELDLALAVLDSRRLSGLPVLGGG